MRTLRTSVRRLVEFLLRSGDIDSGSDWRGAVEAMRAGSDIHRKLQTTGGASYRAEVPLACSVFFPGGEFSPHAARLEIPKESVLGQEGYFLHVEGRADGIVDDGVNPIVIDEIKGVSRDVSDLQDAAAVHEAQALCYAYLYLRDKLGSTTISSAFSVRVVVRLTYASMDTGEVRRIERMHDAPDIEDWFFSLLRKAQRWASWRVRHDELRARSLSSLEFPLAARGGQQQIMDAVASAIRDGRRLYVQAPTGSGKTLATLYPALKAMGAGEVAHIAYLTAKTMTREPVLEGLGLFRRQSFAANALVVTARDKVCPLRGNARGAGVRARPLASLCNPVECPLARGHYDSVNDALFEAIATHDVLDAGRIKGVAARHHVCPYELQRDAARWSDVIVCDYHYAFAPSGSLFGLADGSGGDTVFLVDEAHNLVTRMRDMYSASLAMADLRALQKVLHRRNDFGELRKAVSAVVSAFPAWDKALPEGERASERTRGRRPRVQVVRMSEGFVDSLHALADGTDAALERLLRAAGSDGGVRRMGMEDHGTVEAFLAVRDVNLSVRSLLGALQRSETGYVSFLGRSEPGGRRLKIYCVDPSHDLDGRLEQAKAAVFFSGTLLPMDYHRRLLAAREDDASIYAHSGFDYGRQQVLIGSDVSARFSRRGTKLYALIARYLMALTHARPGNYLAFLPSYAMIEEVSKCLSPLEAGGVKVLRQRPAMREDDRERFVSRFRDADGAHASLVGLCVLGGIFGESIDLPGDALVGVVIVGTGMPVATDEREVIREYFDAREEEGFAYAYTYPGMTKVLQAAGRLIRSEEDHGVVLLLDDRFLGEELRRAFPKEWGSVRACTLETMPGLLA